MKKLPVFVCLLTLLFPICVGATPISYIASGIINYEMNDQFVEMKLEGLAVIDDDVTLTHGSGGHPFYHYNILNFEIYTPYDYWAGGGELLLEDVPGIMADFIMDDFLWGRGDFKDEDGVSYNQDDVDSWLTLPSQLTMMYADHFYSYDIFRPQYANITLSKIIPVPEPSTLIFIGAGLALFAGTARKSRNIIKGFYVRYCSSF